MQPRTLDSYVSDPTHKCVIIFDCFDVQLNVDLQNESNGIIGIKSSACLRTLQTNTGYRYVNRTPTRDAKH